MQETNSTTDSLKELLDNRVRSRSIVSSRVSALILFSSVSLSSGSIWAAISLDSKVRTWALYILMILYILVSLTISGYSFLTWRRNQRILQSMEKSRSCHKVGYKLLVGLLIFEHCVFFVSIAVMVFHSLGLSLTTCFSHSECTGFFYEGWVTLFSRNGMRSQKLTSRPVVVALSSTQRGLFWAYICTLAIGLIAVGLYFCSEGLRRTVSGKVTPIVSFISLYERRLGMVKVMGACCIISLVCSVIGVSLVGCNWFSAPLILSIASMYPVFILKRGLSREPTVTRFQFRRIAQICISLMLIWLYCFGTGIAVSLISGINLHTEDDNIIMDKTSVAQLVILVVFHLLFAVSCAVGIYLHVSVSDIAESIMRTVASTKVSAEKADKTTIPIADNTQELAKEQSVASWSSKLCASCSTHAPNSVLVPCGHSVICSECCNVLLTIPGFRCPLCCVEVFDCQRSDPSSPRYAV